MMKTQKLEYSEQQSLDTCIRQLEALLESLKAASVSLSRNGNKLWLRPGATVDVRLSAEQSGDREQLQICLGWRRRSLIPDDDGHVPALRSPGAAGSPGGRPRTARRRRIPRG